MEIRERVDDHLAEPAGDGRIPLYDRGELTADDDPVAPLHDIKVDAEHGWVIAQGKARRGEGKRRAELLQHAMLALHVV